MKDGSFQPGAARFQTTSWSLVLQTGKPGAEPERRAALEMLCQRYWYPLYFFIRRKGYPHSDAQDLVQSFFEQMLAAEVFEKAEASRGRFRTFLLTCLDRHLQQAVRKASTQRRGGGIIHLPLETGEMEKRYEAEPVALEMSIEKWFDRQWAQEVIRTVMQRLQEEFDAANKGRLFAALQPFLVQDRGETSYHEVAMRLGIGVNAVRTAIHRFRQRYARVFREEIAATVERPEEVDEEIRELLTALEPH